MKKMLIGTLALSGLILASCDSDPEVASTEAGGRIRQEEFYERMKNQPAGQGSTIGEQILQQMLIEDILEEAYGDVVSDEDVDAEYEEMAEGMGGVETFEQTLEMQGIDPEQYKEEIRMSMQLREAVRERIEISEEDLQAMYDDLTAIPVGTRVAHILVMDEEEANEVIAELEDGADFGELVSEYSQDPGSVENEGEYELTEELLQGFDPVFLDGVAGLEEGEYTTEPVLGSNGYHIIQLIEVGEEESESFEDMRDQLENQYVDNFMGTDQTILQQTLYELVSDANVQISDDDLASAMDMFLTAPEDPELPIDDLPIDDLPVEDEDSSEDEETEDEEDSEDIEDEDTEEE